MSDIGIKSYAAYIPRLRMDRASIAAAHAWALPALKGSAKGERAFCSWDEDTITMSVEAVRNCHGSHAPSAVRALTFASTTAVFADLQNASLVVTAAGLPDTVSTLDATGSLRAGTSAVIRALESREAGDVIVVAADNRLGKPGSQQEMQYGSASFALRLGAGEVIAKFMGSASSALQFVDHFRAQGDHYDYQWEERWIRDEGYLKIVPETLARLFKTTAVRAEAIDHFCLPSTIAGIAAAVARQSKIKPEAVVDNLAVSCGDTGVPHPLVMLGLALERAKPGEKILVVGFGAGCDALLFEATAALATYVPRSSVSTTLARGVSEKSYEKLLSFTGQLTLDWGMRSETDAKTVYTQLYRAIDQVAGFVGGRCPGCAAIQFPRLATCVNCGSTEPMTPAPLADAPAKVATFTADWLMFYLAPPLYVGLVQFDNGARVLMEMVDVDAANFEVGSPLRMVYRIKEKDSRRHYDRYFWKAAPLV